MERLRPKPWQTNGPNHGYVGGTNHYDGIRRAHACVGCHNHYDDDQFFEMGVCVLPWCVTPSIGVWAWGHEPLQLQVRKRSVCTEALFLGSA